MEAIVKGQKERPNDFPRIITCPNEMVLSLGRKHLSIRSDRVF